MTDDSTDVTALPAHRQAALLRARQLSCRALMQATLDRIARLNPAHNALVHLRPADELLAEADARDAELARGEDRGWLHGLPMAPKDLTEVAGLPTTRGCTLLARHVSPRDSVMAGRLRAAGAVFIGRSTTPELGLGSHTFSTLHGVTRNAWDPAVSAGGSSGGAAVALALGLLPVADGSDFMGSLRNPAGWNHVFGLRPTQGRVPTGPGPEVWLDQLGTEGPMARTVEDLARLLQVQAGADPQLPLSLRDAFTWETPADPPAALRGLRIGWLGDLGGHLAMEDGVLDACREALRACEAAGAVVEDATLGVEPQRLWDCWLTWRRALVGPRVDALLQLPGAREALKPEALWEWEGSRGLSWADVQRAAQVRSAYFQKLQALLGPGGRWDVLALPSAQCWPFAVDERWPRAIAGRSMDTYHRWMEVTVYATLAGVPAVCVPAGFHPQRGWPMGLQLIGAYGADAPLLRVAAGYEAVREAFIGRRPPG
jgi:amidase